jgi:glutamine synthetase
MSDSQRSSLGIKSLPGSLEESLGMLKSDCDYLKLCFNNDLLETYLMLKQGEITEAENKSKTQ